MFQIESVIESKFPAFGGRRGALARPTLAILRKVLREAEVNAFLAQTRGVVGAEFIDRILEYFNFSYTVVGREVENIPAEGRVVIVANHPLGLLDGVALLKVVSAVRRDVRIVANDVLLHFEPLHPVLLPVVNLGSGGNKANVQAIHEALSNDEAVVIFPSGEVSRAGLRGIRDGRWQAGFLRFAEQARAPVLPVHLDGRNSALFYSLSTLFKPLSTLMLVNEAMRQRNGSLRVRIGELIPWREIAADCAPRRQKIARLSGHLYDLPRNRPVAFRTEKAIAHPEARLDLRRELRAAEHLGRTQDGKEIHLVDGRTDSAVMRELGRLREVAFRRAGEGTGRRRDLDAFDTYYKHIVLWDEADLQIVGAYRLAEAGPVIAERGPAGLYSNTLFEFDAALSGPLSQAVELGRSFVQPRYQGLRALDYLWYGIGAYLRGRPELRYLFGPVSISAACPEEARQLLVRHYARHHGCERALARPRHPLRSARSDEGHAGIIRGEDATTDFRALKTRLQELGVGVPTLYKQYTELCEPGGAQFLGFGLDPAFGHCIDGLVLVDLQRIKPSRRERYLGGGRGRAVTEPALQSSATSA